MRALFEFQMQRLQGFKVLLIDDAKSTHELHVKGDGHFQNQYVLLLVQDCKVLVLGGVLAVGCYTLNEEPLRS